MFLPELNTDHWIVLTVQIVQRLFIVVVSAFIAIRLKGLRQALRGADLSWPYQLAAMLVFGALAIVGTHSGILIDMRQDGVELDLTSEVPAVLGQNQAIVGFRDTMTLVSGMIGGPFVGLGAGMIAGWERYQLGGLAGLSSGLATLMLGLFAGLIRSFRRDWLASAAGVFWVALIGSLLHRLLILILVHPFDRALALSWEVLAPVVIVNCLGSVLFFWIMRDLDRDRLEYEAREARLLAVQSELRALRAQVYPHFLNNTLNDLNALIRFDPDKARHYVRELADFFKYTRQFAETDLISLADEAAQVQRFLELQRLGLGDKLQDSFDIPAALADLPVLPGCLLTLVENALKHGFKGRPGPYRLWIGAKEDGEDLLLQVKDNGRGIAAERLPGLGLQPLTAFNNGGGVALYQLRQSLKLAFGEPIALNVDSIPEQGALVSLRHPKRSKTQ